MCPQARCVASGRAPGGPHPTRELLGSYVLQLLAPQSLLPGDMAPSPLDRQSPGAEASSPTPHVPRVRSLLVE